MLTRCGSSPNDLEMTADSRSPSAAEPELIAALNQVVDGLTDPDNHYTVFANYYEHQTPERFGERWYITQIWFNADTVTDVELTDRGLVCAVRLNRHDLSQVSRILLPYDQIWLVQSITAKHLDLYHRSDKLNLKRAGDND